MKNIIFGIFMSDCDVYCSDFDIVFAYQDKWEETHSIEKSVITTDNKELCNLLKSATEDNEDLLDDITELGNLTIPILGNCYDDDGGDKPMDEVPEDLIIAGAKLGCVYAPDFGKAFQELYWENNLNSVLDED